MILKVARLGHPVIRTKAQPVAVDKIKTHDFQKLLDDMVETMHEYVGVGLAGPQVHLPLQVAVLEVEHHPRYTDMPSVPLTYLINPVVTILDDSKIDDFEGCLSIPEFREPVTRAQKVTIRAQDAHGKWYEKTGEDLLARAFLHETDHLSGKLYISHISGLKRDLMKRKIRKLIKAGEW